MTLVNVVFVGLMALAGYHAWLALAYGLSALFFFMLIPYGVYLDWKWKRERKRLHPDNNFHNLPLLNAKGFDEDGAPIL